MAGRPRTDPHGRARALVLARRIRSLREARGWTREQLAAQAGVPARTLVRLESEGPLQPGFFTVGALAGALGVSMDELLEETSLSPGLWSAGYEGRTIDSFVSSLMDAGVTTVVDVRLTPISRKPGFSKTRLGEALAGADIDYRHLRHLGNPKENRAPFWEGRLSEGRGAFRRVLHSEQAQEQLGELGSLAARARVAVLCFEADEERCHRQVVLEEVRRRRELPVAPLA